MANPKSEIWNPKLKTILLRYIDLNATFALLSDLPDIFCAALSTRSTLAHCKDNRLQILGCWATWLPIVAVNPHNSSFCTAKSPECHWCAFNLPDCHFYIGLPPVCHFCTINPDWNFCVINQPKCQFYAFKSVSYHCCACNQRDWRFLCLKIWVDTYTLSVFTSLKACLILIFLKIILHALYNLWIMYLITWSLLKYF